VARFLSLVAILLLAACGSGGAGVSPASGQDAPASGPASAKASGGALNIAYVAPADSFLWENVAFKQGLFPKYGVSVNEPVFVGGTPRLGQALVGGSFEMAGVGFAAATEADAAGADLEAVAAVSRYSGFALLLPPGSPIKDPKQLKDKTIVLSQIGDTADGFLTALLEKNGLNRNSDVKVVQAGSTSNARAALFAKQADAASVGNAEAFVGEATGGSILANSRQLGQLQPQGSVLVRKSWAESHRPQVLGVVKAMIAANALYRSSQDQAIKLLQDSGWFKDVSVDVLKLIYKDDIENWTELPLVDEESVKAVVQLEAARNPAVGKVNPGSLYDNSYVQELVKDGFVKSVMPDFKGA